MMELFGIHLKGAPGWLFTCTLFNEVMGEHGSCRFVTKNTFIGESSISPYLWDRGKINLKKGRQAKDRNLFTSN